METLLIPAQIIDKDEIDKVVVQEGTDVVLSCKATGVPEPEYTWKMEDPIRLLYHHKTFVNSLHTENISFVPVLPHHTGTYICYASNGLALPDMKRVRLEVHFSHDIKIDTSDHWVEPDSKVELKCLIKAYPLDDVYWLRRGQRIEKNSQYQMWLQKIGDETSTTLKLNWVDNEDYGPDQYQCFYKSGMKEFFGNFSIFRKEIPNEEDDEDLDQP